MAHQRGHARHGRPREMDELRREAVWDPNGSIQDGLLRVPDFPREVWAGAGLPIVMPPFNPVTGAVTTSGNKAQCCLLRSDAIGAQPAVPKFQMNVSSSWDT